LNLSQNQPISINFDTYNVDYIQKRSENFAFHLKSQYTTTYKDKTTFSGYGALSVVQSLKGKKFPFNITKVNPVDYRIRPWAPAHGGAEWASAHLGINQGGQCPL